MSPLSPPSNEDAAENFIYFLHVQCKGHIQTWLLQRKKEIIAKDKQFFLLKIIYIANSHRWCLKIASVLWGIFDSNLKVGRFMGGTILICWPQMRAPVPGRCHKAVMRCCCGSCFSCLLSIAGVYLTRKPCDLKKKIKISRWYIFFRSKNKHKCSVP